MSRSSRRGPWLPEEDATLLHLVRTQGPNNWVRISQHMQHRSPKQCRERYHQNLKPSLNHEPISTQEGELIEQLVREMGKRWAEIARRLGNRSDNAVKNWWNGSMNRRKRSTISQSGGSKMVGYRTQPIPALGLSHPEYTREASPSTRDVYKQVYFRQPMSQQQETEQGVSAFGESRAYRGEPNHDSRGDADLCRDELHPTAFKSASHQSMSPSYQHQASGTMISSHLPWSNGLSPSDHGEWQLPPLSCIDRPLLSPAATEVSQQAPSLVSDNQSNCSISPKTISSPRPGMPAPTEPAMRSWMELPARNWADHASGSKSERYGTHRDGSLETALPDKAHPRLHITADPVLQRPISLPDPATFLRSPQRLESITSLLQSQKAPSLERDNRMNVSSILD